MDKTTNSSFPILCKPFDLWCRRRESNDTRLLILRNLLQTHERKNRTTRCMPASYVQNHVQRNRALGRCSSTQVLRRLLYLHACFFGASIRCVPGPCSIQWKARATTFCRQMATHSVLSFEALASAAVSLTLMAAGHASGWPILRGGAFLQEIQYLTSQSEHQGTRLPRASPFPAPTLEI